jgi:hypothetical protein
VQGSKDLLLEIVSDIGLEDDAVAVDRLGAQMIQYWKTDSGDPRKVIDIGVWTAMLVNRADNLGAPYLLGVSRLCQMAMPDESIAQSCVCDLLLTFLCATLVPNIVDHPGFACHVIPALQSNMCHPAVCELPDEMLNEVVVTFCAMVPRISPANLVGLTNWPSCGRGREIIRMIAMRLCWFLFCQREEEERVPTEIDVMMATMEELNHLVESMDIDCRTRASALVVMIEISWRVRDCQHDEALYEAMKKCIDRWPVVLRGDDELWMHHELQDQVAEIGYMIAAALTQASANDRREAPAEIGETICEILDG